MCWVTYKRPVKQTAEKDVKESINKSIKNIQNYSNEIGNKLFGKDSAKKEQFSQRTSDMIEKILSGKI